MPHKDPAKAKEYFRNYYLTHAEKKKEQSRRRDINLRRSSPQYRADQLVRSTRWAREHPERIAEITRMHNYGISADEYNKKKQKQKNRCALCGKKETNKDKSGKIKSLSVDHDHKLNVVRDLLCGSCNRGLGFFFENVETLSNAIKYLKKHKGV
jgi:hypothetical protein